MATRFHRKLAFLAGPMLALISIAGTVLVIEAFLRLTWQAPPPAAPREIPDELRGLPKLKTVFDLVQPNVRGTYKGGLYETNSAGFRGREYSPHRPAGVFRIVIVGDSITMGSGILWKDAYPARLERALNATRTDRRYEVLNLGVDGSNIEHVVTRLKDKGLRYEPDLVVYGFTVNDLEGPAYRSFPRNPALPGKMFGYKNNEHSLLLVRLLRPRWDSLRELIDPPKGSYLYELDYNFFQNPDAMRAFGHGLDELARIGKEQGICVDVFIHTSLYYLNRFHPFHRYYEVVAEAAKARGLFVARSFPAFKGHDAFSLWVGLHDPHPNAEGHALLAQALLEGLNQLPAECWVGRNDGS